MSSGSLKLLVAGDVNGNFSRLFQRVSTANIKSGPFEMLFCVGDFFGIDNSEWQLCLDGQIQAPIPTYILGPTRDDQVKFYRDKNGAELCPNIIYLGKRGVFNGASGLKVAYLSGVESLGNQSTDSVFTSEDMEAVAVPLLNIPSYKGVDVLLTSVWPKDVTKFGLKPDNDPSPQGSILIAKLSKALKPRYHFCGQNGIHYEPPPFRNHKVLHETPAHPTRFIALGKVGNKANKWLYAFTLTPMASLTNSELVKLPLDITESPYQFDNACLTKKAEDKTVQYFYDVQSTQDDVRGGKKRHANDKREPFVSKRPTPSQSNAPCWFCLGSPKAEKHLVVSVGEKVYLSLAKGGLVPDHILISTIGHFQSTVELQHSITEEIEKYKLALTKYYASKQKVVVFFERNYKTQHLQVQAVPLPKATTNKIKQTFMEIAESQYIRLDEIPKHADISQIVAPGSPYFYAELPNGDKLLTQQCRNFPLQFGREVLAHAELLNIPHKTDWKECKSSVQEETEMAADFKQSFKPFYL